MKEKEVRKKLLKKLKSRSITDKLEKELPHDTSIKIDEKVRIPYKITLKPEDSSYLEARHFEQDILIYSESSIIEEKNPSLTLYNTSEDMVIVPYIILEIKKGEGGSSHDLMAYSTKADDIRTIFPFSKYFMVIRKEPAKRVAFHGKNFDEIHSLKSEYPSNWDVDGLVDKINQKFPEIKEDIIALQS